MISAKINRKQGNVSKGNNSGVMMMYQQKNTIKNYLISRPVSINLKNGQSNNGNIQKTKLRQQLTINDENCSYNANIINPTNLLEQQKQCITQTNIDKHNNEKLPNDNTTNIISLKKKIKKCQYPLPNYNFFREKITFKKKLHQISNQQPINPSQSEQTFYIYRQREVFTSQRSRQLMSRIVIQRMDNDTETDDQQVRSFVKRMSGDFVQHVGKVKAKGELIGSQIGLIDRQQQEVKQQLHEEDNHH